MIDVYRELRDLAGELSIPDLFDMADYHYDRCRGMNSSFRSCIHCLLTLSIPLISIIFYILLADDPNLPFSKEDINTIAKAIGPTVTTAAIVKVLYHLQVITHLF